MVDFTMPQPQHTPLQNSAFSSVGDDSLHEVLAEFFTEAEEGLDRLESELIRLETLIEVPTCDPNVLGDSVDELGQGFQVLGAGAGYLGLEKMTQLAQAGEAVLDSVREGAIELGHPVLDALLHNCELLKTLLVLHKAQADDAAVEVAPLMGALEALLDGQVLPLPERTEMRTDARGEMAPVTKPQSKTLVTRTTGDRRVRQDERRGGLRRQDDVTDTAREGAQVVPVELARLYELSALVAELTPVQAMIWTMVRTMGQGLVGTDEGEAASSRLTEVSEALQRAVRNLRTVPLARVLAQVEPLVRDLTEALGKSVDLQVHDGGVEVERALAGALQVPLLELVRGALKHGIETPDEREASGKLRDAVLLVTAVAEAGVLMIQVQDDGCGADALAANGQGWLATLPERLPADMTLTATQEPGEGACYTLSLALPEGGPA